MSLIELDRTKVLLDRDGTKGRRIGAGQERVDGGKTYAGLNVRSTRIIGTAYFYFGLVLGFIDADLCKYYKFAVFGIYVDEICSAFHEPDPQTNFRDISYQAVFCSSQFSTILRQDLIFRKYRILRKEVILRLYLILLQRLDSLYWAKVWSLRTRPP